VRSEKNWSEEPIINTACTCLMQIINKTHSTSAHTHIHTHTQHITIFLCSLLQIPVYLTQRCISVTVTSDKHMLLVDSCQIVGTVHFHIRWPHVQFPLTVSEYDRRQNNQQCHVLSYVYKTRCFVPSVTL